MNGADDDHTWIFGYGSLIWRPDFPHAERRPGFISGFARRFWQASPDHRGTPELPGRVVTLIRETGADCWGMAYRLEPHRASLVLRDLDHRERAGYQRERVEVRVAEGVVSALVYWAKADNANFVGPAPETQIVETIRDAHGPSGSNREYVLQLANALRGMGAHDSHVFEIERLLAATD